MALTCDKNASSIMEHDYGIQHCSVFRLLCDGACYRGGIGSERVSPGSFTSQIRRRHDGVALLLRLDCAGNGDWGLGPSSFAQKAGVKRRQGTGQAGDWSNALPIPNSYQ